MALTGSTRKENTPVIPLYREPAKLQKLLWPRIAALLLQFY